MDFEAVPLPQEKKCTKCGGLYPLERFVPDKRRSDGKGSWCRKCVSVQNRAWFVKNRERELSKSRGRKIRDHDKILVSSHNYNISHREENNERFRRKYATDPEFKIKHMLRARGSLGALAKGKGKAGSAVKDLGCSYEEWKGFFGSSLVKRGWDWSDLGRWGVHIDHIIPLDSFDLSDRDQCKKAFHYTNLQPLWWDENKAKGKKEMDPNFPVFMPYRGKLVWSKVPEYAIHPNRFRLLP
jgi:hypothetical protein